MKQLLAAYGQLSIGNPLEDLTLIGPLIDEDAAEEMQAALDAARAEGGVVHGGERLVSQIGHGVYVNPALIEISKDALITQKETFAPITYVIPVSYTHLTLPTKRIV